MQIKSNTFILLVVGLLGYMVPKAQDIHFTMFDLSPLTLNPGLIGDFNGTFRVTGNYRIQWPTIAKYQTPSIGIDAPLLKGFRKMIGLVLVLLPTRTKRERAVLSS